MNRFADSEISGRKRWIGALLPDSRKILSSVDLIIHLTRRNFVLRFKGSVIGVLWSLLMPLSQLVVLVFLFDKILPLQIGGYPAFVLTALLPWNWFSSCLTAAGVLFIGNRDLMRMPDFEPVTLIVVEVLVHLCLYLVFLPILMVVLKGYDRPFTGNVLSLPVMLFIQAVWIGALSLFVATYNVFYRDVQYIVSVGLMLLFYLTPVFYSTQHLSDRYQWVFWMNPMAVLIDGYRNILFDGMPPNWTRLGGLAVLSILIGYVSYGFYRRRLSEMIDLL